MVLLNEFSDGFDEARAFSPARAHPLETSARQLSSRIARHMPSDARSCPAGPKSEIHNPKSAISLSMDQIHLHGLDLPTRIGVPAEERAAWQTLQADVTLTLRQSFDTLADDLTQTIDYAAVATRLRALAAERPRQLIETLVSEMATLLLTEFHPASLTLELRKRILPGTDHVAVRITRERNL
jgi:dihydroneopterin aldolase